MKRRTRYDTKLLPPTPAEFKTQARRAFTFLIRDFGFREEAVPAGPHNPVAVWFVNATTRVIVEGINHAADARVALGHTGRPEDFENNDLLDLAAVCCPTLNLNEEQQRAEQEGGQWVQLPRLAAWLRDCGADVLRGDFSSFAAIARRREHRMVEWSRQAASDTPEA